jgi:hypothetical protein
MLPASECINILSNDFNLFLSVMVYTWSFAAGKPSFRCKLYDNDTVFNHYNPVLFNQSEPDQAYCKANMKISVKECQRCYKKINSTIGITQIEACREFVFDRKYYQYTLVEEVCILFFKAKYFTFYSSISGQWYAIEQYFVLLYKIFFSWVIWLDQSFLESSLISILLYWNYIRLRFSLEDMVVVQ